MRFLPLDDKSKTEMMQDIGIKDIEELFLDIPLSVRSDAIQKIDLPTGISEKKVLDTLKSMAKENITTDNYASFLGAGAHKHYIPALVNYIISRGEFLTSYTPYQPEVAQGTLELMFNFQTQVAKIMGLEVANASMYDGASSCAEAVTMAVRINKKQKVLVSGNIHPYYRETISALVKNLGIEVLTNSFNPYETEDLAGKVDDSLSAVVVQNPDFTGRVTDFTNLSKKCKENKVLLIVTGAEPLAFGVIKSPGEMGADIACYEGMGLASNLNFGGPALGLFATKNEYIRQMPGRLIGKTVDKDSKDGYVLTLSTREQHIRRDKATSNICSNSGLMAGAFSIHLSMLGGVGFKNLATLNHAKAVNLYNEIKDIPNVKVLNNTFFNEFMVELKIPAKEFVKKAMEHSIFAGVLLSKFYKGYDNILIIALSECVKTKDILKLANLLREI